MNLSFLVIKPFLISFGVAVFLTPVIIFIFKQLGWTIDSKKDPHPAHTHKGKIPKGGGVVIVTAVTMVAILFLEWDRHLWGIFLGLWLSLAIGLVDDVTNKLSPYVRLLFNFAVASLVVGAGIGIAFVSNPLGGGIIDLSQFRLGFDFLGNHHQIWILADVFALIWIPFLMNAVNWSSGVDGQVSGVIVVAAAVIGVVSLFYSADITQWPVSILAFSLSGAFAGFLVYHFYPQKIMPGYSGTSTAGFLLAILAILSTAKVGTVLVVLGLPLIDAVYSIIRRVLMKRSPVWGDRGHLHHKLLDLGWSKRKISLFYGIVTALLGVIALATGARFKLFVILGLALLIIIFFLWNYFWPFLRLLGRDSG